MYSTVDACKSDTCWAAAASTEFLRQLRKFEVTRGHGNSPSMPAESLASKLAWRCSPTPHSGSAEAPEPATNDGLDDTCADELGGYVYKRATRPVYKQVPYPC